MANKEEEINDKIGLPRLQKAYSALLSLPSGSNDALFQFIEVENNLIRKKCLEQPQYNRPGTRPTKVVLPWVFRPLVSTSVQSKEQGTQSFWKRMFSYVCVSDVHCLEYVIKQSLYYLKSEQWTEGASVLIPFPELKPLVLLIAWDYFRDDFRAKETLVELLWSVNPKTINVLESKCNQLAYLVALTKWCASKLVINTSSNGFESVQIGGQYFSIPDGTPLTLPEIKKKSSEGTYEVKEPSGVASIPINVVFTMLQTHSILYVLQSSLPSIPTSQILEMLKQNPQQHLVAKDRVLLHSYYAIKNVVDLLHELWQIEQKLKPQIQPEVYREKASQTMSHISSIDDPAAALEVLQIMFSLFFTKSSSWKTQSKNVQLQSPTERDTFVSSYEFVEVFIRGMKEALKSITERWSTPTDSLKPFSEVLEESHWRIQLVKKLVQHSHELSQSPFFNLMLATPETLLIMCIRQKDWASCKAVVDFFKLPSKLSELFVRAQNFSQLCTKIQDTTRAKMPSIDLLLEGIGSVESKFLMCLDLIATNSSWNPQFFEKSQSLLSQLDKEIQQSSFVKLIHNYLQRFELFYQFPEYMCDLSHLHSTYLEDFPLNSAQLTSYLHQRSSLQRAKNTLIEALKPLSSLHQSEQSDVLLVHLLNSLKTTSGASTPNLGNSWSFIDPNAEGDPNEEVGEEKFNFLVCFLRYLKKLGDFVSGDLNIGLQNYFLHLNVTPMHILSNLVFQSKNYNQAEKLAQSFQMDLIETILSSTEASREVPVSSSQAPSSDEISRTLSGDLQIGRGPRHGQKTPSQQSKSYSRLSQSDSPFSSQVGSYNPHPFATPLSAIPEPTTVNVPPQPGAFSLGMSEVLYIGEKYPIHAILSCILLSPPSKFSVEMLSYAFTESMSHPVLHRWVSQRCRVYGVFQDVFINQRADSILNNLDLSIPVESIGNNDARRWGRKFNKKPEKKQGPKSMGNISASLPVTFAGQNKSLLSPADSPSTGPVSFNNQSVEERESPNSSSNPDHFPNKSKLLANFASQENLPADSIQFYISIMQENTITGDQVFFEHIIEKIMVSSNLEKALEISDSVLPYGAPDFLLRSLIDKNENKSVNWRWIMRLSDKLDQAKLILKYMEFWTLEAVLDLLFMSSEHLKKLVGMARDDLSKTESLDEISRRKHSSSIGSQRILPSHLTSSVVRQSVNRDECLQLITEIESFLVKCNICSEIMQISPDAWTSWHSILSLAMSDASLVVTKVLASGQFELARKITKWFKVPTNIILKIEEKYLLNLLGQSNPDLSLVQNHLFSFPSTEGVFLAQKLLEIVKDNSTRLFLIHFLRNRYGEGSKETLMNSLSNQEIGVRMLIQLPMNLQISFEELREYPELIFESLIMSEQLTVLSTIVLTIPELLKGKQQLIAAYARKALFVSNPESQESTESDRLLSTDREDQTDDNLHRSVSREKKTGPPSLWVLTPQNQRKLRAMHVYPNVPRHQLTTRLFDLCPDFNQVGREILSLCDSLSEELSSPQLDRLFVVHIIQQLLYYAKARFDKENNNGAVEKDEMFDNGAQDCDAYLARVQLLQQLIFSNINFGEQKLSLSTFSDPNKSRIVRDLLVEHDQMELAINLATRCNIECEPVWVQWGLSLLKVGKYIDAKEKFSNVFAETEGADTYPRHAKVSQRELVARIIYVLESNTPSDAEKLRTRLQNLKKTLPQRQAKMNAGLDQNEYLRVLQVKQQGQGGSSEVPATCNVFFYLTRYGTPSDLIAFWLKHRLLEDALRYILQNGLEKDIFISVVNRALNDNRINQFKDYLQRIDPSKKKWQPYLEAAAKHFQEKHLYQPLMDLLIYMDEYVRAGMISVKLFQTCTEYQGQLKYLDDAKAYFTKGSQVPISSWAYSLFGDEENGDETMAEDFQQSEFNEKKITSVTDINRLIRMTGLQIEVVKLLKSKGMTYPTSNVRQNLALFGNIGQKSKIAECVLALSEFDLSFRLMQEYRLSTGSIYNNVLSDAARAGEKQKMTLLLKNIKPMARDEEWDEVILTLVTVYVTYLQDLETAEAFIPEMRNAENEVVALVLCQRLRAAYIKAVRLRDPGTVRTYVTMIRDEADRLGNTREKENCETWLNSAR